MNRTLKPLWVTTFNNVCNINIYCTHANTWLICLSPGGFSWFIPVKKGEKPWEKREPLREFQENIPREAWPPTTAGESGDMAGTRAAIFTPFNRWTIEKPKKDESLQVREYLLFQARRCLHFLYHISSQLCFLMSSLAFVLWSCMSLHILCDLGGIALCSVLCREPSCRPQDG